MTDERPPDYRSMTGAQFQAAVGTDPAKWAEAFTQVGRPWAERSERVALLTVWFRDAMEAARAERGPLLG